MSVFYIQNKGVQKSKSVFLFGSTLLIALSVLLCAPQSTRAAGVDVYVKVVGGAITDATFTGDGSALNPYGVPAGNIDAVMTSILNPSTTEYVLKNQPADTKVVIHLANGTYLTAGHSEQNNCGLPNGCLPQWTLPSNTSIVGESRDGTIIKLDDTRFTASNKSRLAEIFVVKGDGFKLVSGVKAVPDAEGIKNLTIDGNYKRLVEKFNTAPYNAPSTLNRVRVHGVELFGQGNFVDTFRLKDIGNYAGGYEAFGVLLLLSDPGVADPNIRYNASCTASPTDTNCSRIVNSIYEDNVLHPSLNDSQNKFGLVTLFNITGSWNSNGVNNDPTDPSRKDVFMNGSVIANNKVIILNTYGEENHFQGFSMHHTYNGKVFNNETNGIQSGYYSDWWQEYNEEIYNNKFLNTSVAIDIKVDDLPNFKKVGYNIHDNEITVVPVNDGARAGIRLTRNKFSSSDTKYYPPSPYARELKNFKINNNRISFAWAPSGVFGNSALLITEVAGLEISNNIFDSRFNQVTSTLPESYRYFYLPEQTAGGLKYKNSGVSVSGNTNTLGGNIDCLLMTDQVFLFATSTHQANCTPGGVAFSVQNQPAQYYRDTDFSITLRATAPAGTSLPSSATVVLVPETADSEPFLLQGTALVGRSGTDFQFNNLKIVNNPAFIGVPQISGVPKLRFTSGASTVEIPVNLRGKCDLAKTSATPRIYSMAFFKGDQNIADSRPFIQEAFDCAATIATSEANRVTIQFEDGLYRLKSSSNPRYNDLQLGNWGGPGLYISLLGLGVAEIRTETDPGILPNGTANPEGRDMIDFIENLQGLSIRNLVFNSIHVPSAIPTHGLALSGGSANSIKQFTITDNTFKNFQLMLSLAGVSGGTVTHNQFLMEKGNDSGNACEQCGPPQVGLWMFDNPSGSNSGLVITNNDYDGCADPSYNLATQSKSHLCGDGFLYGVPVGAIISNNRISHFSFEAMNFGHQRTHGVTTITNNIISGLTPPGTKNLGGHTGIRVDVDGTIVSENTITDVGTGVISSSGDNPTGNFENLTIRRNTIGVSSVYGNYMNTVDPNFRMAGIVLTGVNNSLIEENEVHMVGTFPPPPLSTNYISSASGMITVGLSGRDNQNLKIKQNIFRFDNRANTAGIYVENSDFLNRPTLTSPSSANVLLDNVFGPVQYLFQTRSTSGLLTTLNTLMGSNARVSSSYFLSRGLTIADYQTNYSNLVSSTIGGYTGEDTVAPVRTLVTPTSNTVNLPAGTTSTNLQISTDETSACRFATSPNVAYSTMAANFAPSNAGKSHFAIVSGLTDGLTRTYYIRCIDTASIPNANTTDLSVTVSVATPPVVFAVSAQSALSTVTVERGQSISNTITVTNSTTATSRPVTFVMTSGMGAGMTYTFNPAVCTPNPTCNTVLNISTSDSTLVSDNTPIVVGLLDDTRPLSEVQFSLAVTRASQSITFDAISDKVATDTFVLTPLARSIGPGKWNGSWSYTPGQPTGLPIIFSVVSGGNASIVNNTISFVGAGDVTIRASQNGSTGYLPATPVERTFHVAKATGVINFDEATLTQTYSGTTKFVVATSPLGKRVDLTYRQISRYIFGLITSVNEITTAPQDAGEYEVTATINDAQYAGTEVRTLIINKAPQIIRTNFATLALQPDRFVGTRITLSALSDAAGPVGISISGTGSADIMGNELTFTREGQVIVRASHGEDNNYLAAPDTEVVFTVSRSNATILLNNDPKVYTGSPISLSVTTIPENLPYTVTYAGSPVAPTNVGVYEPVVVTVDTPLRTAQATGRLTIVQADQTITFPPIADEKKVDEIFDLDATTTSKLPLTLSVSGPAELGVNSANGKRTLKVTGVGVVEVTATQGGNTNYKPATPKSVAFSTVKNTASINFVTASLTQVYDGTAKAVVATTNPVGKQVNLSYRQINSFIGLFDSVSSSPTAPVRAGRYEVTATVSDAGYVGTAQAELVINRRAQTITTNFPTSTFDLSKFVNGSVDLSAVTSVSGEPATFSVSDSTMADITATANPNIKRITFKKAGQVTVTASYPENDNYLSVAGVPVTFTVSKNPGNIWINTTAYVYDGTSKDPVISTSPVGLPVRIDYADLATTHSNVGNYPFTATITDPAYTGTTVGNNQLRITQANQVITFADIAPDRKVGNVFDLNVTSTSLTPVGLVVTSVPPGAASLGGAKGNTLTIHTEGQITITASQPATPNYFIATSEAKVFTATKTATNIGLVYPANTVYDGSQKVVTYTVDRPVPASSISVKYNGSLIPPTNAGVYAVVARIDDVTYSGEVSGTMTITKAPQTIIFTPTASRNVGSEEVLSASGTQGAVTFAVVSGIADINPSTKRITYTTPGVVRIRASAAEMPNYSPIYIEREITVFGLRIVDNRTEVRVVSPRESHIKWDTNIGATSQVVYAPTVDWTVESRRMKTPLVSGNKTSHEVILLNLRPKTEYTYKVISKDADGNEAFNDPIFTTADEPKRITTSTSGAGSGTITLSLVGTSCGANCQEFSFGTQVTITATPALGSLFSGFAGCSVSGPNSCVVTLDQDHTVNAVFSVAGPGVIDPLTINSVIATTTGSTDFSGWAWSSNIGWISFNATNTDAGGGTYKLVLDNATREFSGYAWSPAIGWITFNKNQLVGCPSGECSAKLVNDNFSGWARACNSMFQFMCGLSPLTIYETERLGGFDGWISLNNKTIGEVPYGPKIVGNQLTGFAWGDKVFGWISFEWLDQLLRPIKPNVKITLSDVAVMAGQTTTITWEVENADSCVASGGWTGNKSKNGGTEVSGNIVAGTTFFLNCSGPGGESGADASVGITTTQIPPAITIEASPSTVLSGTNTVLSWKVSNATACTASNNTGNAEWSGNTGVPIDSLTTENKIIHALTQTTQFVLTCSKGALSTSESVTVVVTNLPVAPSVSLTSPINNAQFREGSTVTLIASASDTDGTISSVKFYDGAMEIATDTSAPYEYSYVPSVGTHAFKARATDNTAMSTDSGTVSVIINALLSPTITLTAPTANSQYTIGANVTLSATASDADGTITQVQFYDGATLLNTDTVSPYTYVYQTPPVGTHQLKAKATDNDGRTAETSDVNVSVVGLPPLPTTHISVNPSKITPLGAVVSTANQNTLIEWSSQNAENGCEVVSNPPTNWNGHRSPSGSEESDFLTQSTTFTATCRGLGGSVTSSATVEVGINPPPVPPTVSVVLKDTSSQNITGPVRGGSRIRITWETRNATACTASGTGDAAASGWNMGTTINPISNGSRDSIALTQTSTFALTCTGAGGTSSDSPTVVVVPLQNPTVSLVVDKTHITYGESITLSATASDTDGTIGRVEFYDGGTLISTDTTAPYSFVYSSPSVGMHQLKAKAIDNDSLFADSADAGVTVDALRAPTISLISPSNGDQFTVGTPVTLSATTVAGSGTISSVKFYDGATVLVTKPGDPSNAYAYTYAPPAGNHQFKAQVLDNNGFIIDSATVGVIVSAVLLPPTVSLTASPQTITSGQSTTLSWTVSDATLCVPSSNPANASWNGTGTKAIPATPNAILAQTITLSTGTQFTLACTGPGGTSTTSANVIVTTMAVAPNIDFTVTIPEGRGFGISGQTVLLSWSATNVDFGCTASGSWSGPKAVSGVDEVSPLLTIPSDTFTLTCRGNGGIRSRQITIEVRGGARLIVPETDPCASGQVCFKAIEEPSPITTEDVDLYVSSPTRGIVNYGRGFKGGLTAVNSNESYTVSWQTSSNMSGSEWTCGATAIVPGTVNDFRVPGGDLIPELKNPNPTPNWKSGSLAGIRVPNQGTFPQIKTYSITCTKTTPAVTGLFNRLWQLASVGALAQAQAPVTVSDSISIQINPEGVAAVSNPLTPDGHCSYLNTTPLPTEVKRTESATFYRKNLVGPQESCESEGQSFRCRAGEVLKGDPVSPYLDPNQANFTAYKYKTCQVSSVEEF